MRAGLASPLLDRRGEFGPAKELKAEPFPNHEHALGRASREPELELRRCSLLVIVHGEG